MRVRGVDRPSPGGVITHGMWCQSSDPPRGIVVRSDAVRLIDAAQDSFGDWCENGFIFRRGAREPFFQSWRSGNVMLWQSLWLRRLLVAAGLLSLVLVPLEMILPQWVHGPLHGNASTLGWLNAAFLLGYVGGALSTSWTQRRPSAVVLGTGMALLGAYRWIWASGGGTLALCGRRGDRHHDGHPRIDGDGGHDAGSTGTISWACLVFVLGFCEFDHAAGHDWNGTDPCQVGHAFAVWGHWRPRSAS